MTQLEQVPVEEEYDYSAGPKKLLAVFFSLIGLLGVMGIIELMKMIYTPVAPLPDGSFPVYDGSLTANATLLILAFIVMCILFTVGMCSNDGKNALPWGIASIAVPLVIVVLGFSTLNGHGEEVWKKSLKTWASEEYGVSYDHITEYQTAGIVGKPGYKTEPTVYIEPPKKFLFLTNKDGSYAAQLIGDYYGSHSVRLYEPSGEGNPKQILPLKNNH